MTSLTVHLPSDLKKKAALKAKQDGVTFTFIVNQMFQAYLDNKIKFGLIKQGKDDNEITASFDVSSEEGKKECLDYFKSL